MLQFDYVIYHKNCFDGFTGLVIFMNSTYHTEDIFIMPDVPHATDAPINIDGKTILIIDVAYKPEILNIISKRSKAVYYIDHHITHQDEISKIKFKSNDKIIYDIEKCGASLTWKTFYNTKMPLFIQYIHDNDNGIWKLKYTLEFIAGLQVHYTTVPTKLNIQKWFNLFNKKETISLIKKGKMYNEYKKYLIELNTKRYSLEGFPGPKIFNNPKFKNQFKKIGQYKVAVYNGNGCPDISLLGKAMVDTLDCDFALFWTYNIDKKTYVISLRSNKVDIEQIASMFGGGGHVLAAAFSLNSLEYSIDDLFMETSLPRYII